jgi:hypothetical protein
MGIEVNLVKKQTHLEVQVSGIYDMQEAMAEFNHVFLTCSQTDLSKVLIDFRQMDGDIAAIEKMIYAMGVIENYKNYLKAGGKRLIFAFLGKAPQISTYEPGLEIARERGIPVILTRDISEAKTFLAI